MRPASGRFQVWNVGLLLTSLIGILGGLAAAVFFGAIAMGLALRGEAGVSLPLWSAVGFGVVAATLTVPAFLAARALFGADRSATTRPSRLWLILIATYPLYLGLGAVAARLGPAEAYLVPVALVGTSALPVMAIVWLVRRLGPEARTLRAWGHFAVGLTWMPIAALGLEMLALLPAVVLLGIWVTSTPEGAALLHALQELPPLDPAPVEDLLAPILGSPAVLVGIFAYVAVAVPLIEEAAKTMAVWPFLTRRISGAEAFLGGALGGAGYALFEALFLSQPGEGWILTTIARGGASLLHVFTAGLTSWGLVTAVRRRRVRLLLGAYAASVGMHAAWNLAALSVGLGAVPIESPTVAQLSGAAPIPLAALALLSLAALLGLTRIWRRLPVEPSEPGP